MRSSVIITRNSRQGGCDYEITVIQQSGRYLTGLKGGYENDLGEVAARAAMYAACHCLPNPLGGDIVGSKNILDLIPPHLLNIPQSSQRETK